MRVLAVGYYFEMSSIDSVSVHQSSCMPQSVAPSLAAAAPSLAQRHALSAAASPVAAAAAE